MKYAKLKYKVEVCLTKYTQNVAKKEPPDPKILL